MDSRRPPAPNRQRNAHLFNKGRPSCTSVQCVSLPQKKTGYLTVGNGGSCTLFVPPSRDNTCAHAGTCPICMEKLSRRVIAMLPFCNGCNTEQSLTGHWDCLRDYLYLNRPSDVRPNRGPKHLVCPLRHEVRNTPAMMCCLVDTEANRLLDEAKEPVGGCPMCSLPLDTRMGMILHMDPNTPLLREREYLLSPTERQMKAKRLLTCPHTIQKCVYCSYRDTSLAVEAHQSVCERLDPQQRIFLNEQLREQQRQLYLKSDESERQRDAFRELQELRRIVGGMESDDDEEPEQGQLRLPALPDERALQLRLPAQPDEHALLHELLHELGRQQMMMMMMMMMIGVQPTRVDPERLNGQSNGLVIEEVVDMD